VKNCGRGLARFPFLRIRGVDPGPYKMSQYGLDGNGHTGLPRQVKYAGSEALVTFSGGMNDVVHPDTTLDISLLQATIVSTTAPLPNLVIHYDLSAEGQPVIQQSAVISGEEVLALARAKMPA